MWTKREVYISAQKDIKEYLEVMDSFHDYRIGNIEVEENDVTVTVEEIVPAMHISESAGRIWDFQFHDILRFKMNTDCVGSFCVGEIMTKDDTVTFACTNGYIEIKALHIQIGIPS